MNFKNLGLLLLALTLLGSCTTRLTKENFKDEVLVIERYESSRRGSVAIAASVSGVKKWTHTNDTISKKIDKEQWNKLVNSVSGLSLNGLEAIESPSKAFMYDGAASVSLQFTTKDSTYYSNPYDKGNPPAAYKAVEELLSSLVVD